ncbi:competence protein CoiA [Yoonia sp.]|uniref:competence protein CoiA n=1 Tax=Yoonia sp. TaxID=2212373 RepID=UPI00358DF835
MRFAISCGRRIEATPGAKGKCPGCDADLLARCGTRKVWHWAHKGQHNCDAWWESETEWHRAWKLKFPEDWCESVQHAPSGERHIADVRTPDGLTIEFQHSHLDERERYSREKFYEEMIWVVDGTRLKRDIKFLTWIHFLRSNVHRSGPIPFNADSYQITARWMGSMKPVFLDFGGDTLWCISPHKDNWQSFAVEIRKQTFVQSYNAGQIPAAIRSLLSEK